MAQKQKWQERLFGKQLTVCSSITKTNECTNVDTMDALKNVDIIGIYFSFANIKCDDIVDKLRDLYERLNAEPTKDGLKKLEIVQVVLWAQNDVYSDFETSHRDSLFDLPWYGMPFSETELKTRLARRYQIKSGDPTLVLLDVSCGTVCFLAQERLLDDPMGLNFPWRPRPLDVALKDVSLTSGGLYENYHNKPAGEIRYSDLPEGIKGFYFSASWCPPCRAFTPLLVDAYNLLRKKDPGFEIIFVSSDRNVDSYTQYIRKMPWLVVPYQQSILRTELQQLYGVRGIPTLILLDKNGHLITMDARADLVEDPLAENFPWRASVVNVLTERHSTRLHDYPTFILLVEAEDTEIEFGKYVLTPVAETYYKKNNININQPTDMFFTYEDHHYVQFLIGAECDYTDVLREALKLEDMSPIFIVLDSANNRFAVMEYGIEINIESVSDFVEKFLKNDLNFEVINDKVPSDSFLGGTR